MITGVKIGMSMADYLAAHGVSQSALKRIARSPAHLRYYLDHPEPPTPDQILGTVLDTAVFAPDTLKDAYYVRPSSYEGEKGEKKPWHNGAKVCKEWNLSHTDKTVIPQADFTDVLLMRDEVFKHPAAALVLKEGATGYSMFCEDADTGLQLKARPDWLSGTVIADLKKCQDASKDGFPRTIANFGYDIQAAFYLDVAKILGLEKEQFVFIAVEDKPPYAVGVYELDGESIEIGRSKYRRLLARYLDCVLDGWWPAYSRNIERLSLPKWAKSVEYNAALLEDRPAQPALEVI